MEATNKENFDGLTSEYLYNHRKLIWMKLNQTNTLSSNAYVVKFVSGSKIMMIARKSFSNYTQVGKVRQNHSKVHLQPSFFVRFHLESFSQPTSLIPSYHS